MGQYLSEPVREKDQADGRTQKIAYGSAEMQGTEILHIDPSSPRLAFVNGGHSYWSDQASRL